MHLCSAISSNGRRNARLKDASLRYQKRHCITWWRQRTRNTWRHQHNANNDGGGRGGMFRGEWPGPRNVAAGIPSMLTCSLKVK